MSSISYDTILHSRRNPGRRHTQSGLVTAAAVGDLGLSGQEKDLSVYAETWFEIWRCRTHAAASETAAYTELLGNGSFAGLLLCLCNCTCF